MLLFFFINLQPHNGKPDKISLIFESQYGILKKESWTKSFYHLYFVFFCLPSIVQVGGFNRKSFSQKKGSQILISQKGLFITNRQWSRLAVYFFSSKNLITDSNKSDQHDRILKQILICYHAIPSFPEDSPSMIKNETKKESNMTLLSEF